MKIVREKDDTVVLLTKQQLPERVAENFNMPVYYLNDDGELQIHIMTDRHYGDENLIYVKDGKGKALSIDRCYIDKKWIKWYEIQCRYERARVLGTLTSKLSISASIARRNAVAKDFVLYTVLYR